MIDFYKKAVLENYANFNGRATRSELWYFILMHTLILITAAVIDNLIGMTFSVGFYGPVYLIYSLLVLIPYYAVTIRRLHDTGKSGWFIFINAILIIGNIWFIVVLCKKSEEGTNEYGPNPHNENELDLLGTE